MATKLLYNLAIPATAQARDRDNRRRQIASDGTLGPGQPSVESISAEAETRRLQAVFNSRFGELMATEFRELWSSSSIDVVPYTSNDTNTLLEEGYYSLERADNLPSTPNERRSQQFEGQLTKVGTRRSHWRAVETAITTEDNPFGTDSSEEIGISAAAEKVRWYDAVDGSLEDASAVATRTGEHGDIAIYDIQNTTITDPTLIYRIDYRDEWPTDVRVWDDRGTSKIYEGATGDTVGSTTVGDGTVSETVEALQWQRVFATDHEYAGTPVLENDLLRLELDEADETIRAYRWDPSTEEYARVSLGDTSWRLFDVNIRRIGTERIGGQVEFRDVPAGDTHNLDLSLKRGYDDVFWTVPQNESAAPQGLVDRLAPIASTSEQDPAGVATVVKRQETDR